MITDGILYPWIKIAGSYVGIKEIPGKESAPIIVKWLNNLKAWWNDDSTPWCGVFMAEVMKEAGINYPPAYYRAKEWLNWGERLDVPVYGCVVVFDRVGGGHVGIVIGKDKSGRLMVIGGNQSDQVSVVPFQTDRVSGYRYPIGYTPPKWPLPVMETTQKSSIKES